MYIYIHINNIHTYTYLYIYIFSTLRTGFPICHFAVYHTTKMMCGVVRSLKMIANSLLQLAENYSIPTVIKEGDEHQEISKNMLTPVAPTQDGSAQKGSSWTVNVEGYCTISCADDGNWLGIVRQYPSGRQNSPWQTIGMIVHLPIFKHNFSTRCGREVSPLKHLESCFAETSEERAA